jgi:hypothetical protein
LERQGIIERIANDSRRGARYLPTEAGKELAAVCGALGAWGARWLDVAPEQLDPYLALWSMCNGLVIDRLPSRRVVIRFEFPNHPRKVSRFWMLIDHQEGEVCVTSPGEEDLIVTADAERFVRWQMGSLSWAAAAADESIRIQGPRQLARSFPTWNSPGPFAHIKRAGSSPTHAARL